MTSKRKPILQKLRKFIRYIHMMERLIYYFLSSERKLLFISQKLWNLNEIYSSANDWNLTLGCRRFACLSFNSICRFTVLVYIVYSLICSFLCNFSVYVLCTVSLRNKDLIVQLDVLEVVNYVIPVPIPVYHVVHSWFVLPGSLTFIYY
jgi:hypothetical protein